MEDSQGEASRAPASENVMPEIGRAETTLNLHGVSAGQRYYQRNPTLGYSK